MNKQEVSNTVDQRQIHKDGKSKNNPHEVSLSKFYRALSRPVSKGYVALRHGQIVKESTLERIVNNG